MNIDKNSRYYFKNHLVWQIEPITETVYVLDKKNNSSFFFEGTGRDIWKMINNKLSVDDFINLLSLRYDVQPTELEDDVKTFIKEIIREDLIYEL